MRYIAPFIICLLLAVVVAVPWVRAIDKTTDEWQEHKDDPDYWD